MSAFSWTGFYVGINGGYSWGTGSQTAGIGSATGTPPFSTGGGMPGTVAPVNVQGGIFGGEIGFNYQISSWVFGLETSIAWTGIQGSTTMGLAFPGGFPSTDSWNSKMTWLATATPRLGWAWNQWLFYGKGGLSGGGVNTSVAFLTATGGAFSATQQRVGWTAGAGLEYGLNKNVVIGIEYNYLNFGTENYAGFGPTNIGGSRFFSENVKLNYSEILGRISYKLY
jgi:outer membrane immunogenic protein